MINKINAELVLYSECAVTNKRIATFVLKVPKFIIPHINSHRALSRNSASSRAVPARKMRERVMKTPFIPFYFGENKQGMQSGKRLTGFRLFIAKRLALVEMCTCVFTFYWRKSRAPQRGFEQNN